MSKVESIIKKIDEEIALLEQAKAVLSGESAPKRRGRPAGVKTAKKRVLSPEARKKIADAQKKRWAKAKKA
jgi:hypothetical protein